MLKYLSIAFRAAIIIAFGSLCATGAAASPLPTGTAQQTFSALSGTLPSINVDLGGGVQSTGVISFTLDGSGNSTFDWNFDTGQAAIHLDLLATFPLQVAIGAAPVPITVVEAGTITGITAYSGLVPDPASWSMLFDGTLTPLGGSSQSVAGLIAALSSQPSLSGGPSAAFSIQTSLFGGGTVSTGPFAGTVYSNFEDTTTIIVITTTPLPATLPLFAAGAGVVGLFSWRRKRRAQAAVAA